MLADTQRLYVELLDASGHRSEGAEAWQRVIDLLAADAETRDPHLKTTLAWAYFRLNLEEALRPLTADLDRIGYRHPDYARLAARMKAAASGSTSQAIVGSPNAPTR